MFWQSANVTKSTGNILLKLINPIAFSTVYNDIRKFVEVLETFLDKAITLALVKVCHDIEHEIKLNPVLFS